MGRAPIVKMSRRMPPTPVAAPWYGSTADGWLWDSILNATASPSPIEMTPAFSPGPATTPSPVVGSVRRSGFELLYEQCSLHITLNMASSSSFGSRPPRRSRIGIELLVGQPETPVERLDDGGRGLGHRHRCAHRDGAGTSTAARAALSTSERTIPDPSSEPRIASEPARVRHQPGDVARSVHDPGDRPQAAVRVRRAVVLGRPRPGRRRRTGTAPAVGLQARRASDRRRNSSPPRARSASATARPPPPGRA